jgi:hypothetical protein
VRIWAAVQLRDAILRGTKVAAKESGGLALNCVRLVPPARDEWDRPIGAGYMLATNGSYGSFVWIDPGERFPDIALDALGAKKAFVGIKKGVPFSIEKRGTDCVSVESAEGAKFLIATRSVRDFPALPVFPAQLHPVGDRLDALRLVHHAAGGDKDKPEVQCVHLTPEYSEATDTSRIARVGAPVVLDPCCITKDVFKSWPRKSPLGCAVGESEGNVFFQVGEELRFTGKIDSSEWFNLSPMLPASHLGHRVRLDREAFKIAVKHALGSTPTTWVALRIGDDQLSVTGIDTGDQATYVQTLSALGARELTVIVLRGRLLWDALHVIPDTVATLCYRSPTEPIRLAGAHYVEAIWPLKAVEG